MDSKPGFSLHGAQDAAKKAEDKQRRDALVSKWRRDLGDAADKRLRGIPSTYHYLFVKCQMGEIRGLKQIKLKCLDCSNWKRDEVANCTARFCPLWANRPFQDRKSKKQNPKAEELEVDDEVYDAPEHETEDEWLKDL